MRLYHFQEKRSGVSHWAVAKTETKAKKLITEIANRPFKEADEEYLYPNDFEKMDIDHEKKLKMYCDTANPIELTKAQWETVYYTIDQAAFYLGCSEW